MQNNDAHWVLEYNLSIVNIHTCMLENCLLYLYVMSNRVNHLLIGIFLNPIFNNKFFSFLQVLIFLSFHEKKHLNLKLWKKTSNVKTI